MLERVLALTAVVGGLLALAAWGLPQDAADEPAEKAPAEAPRALRAMPAPADAERDDRHADDRDEDDDEDRDDEDDDEREKEEKREKERGKEKGKRGRG